MVISSGSPTPRTGQSRAYAGYEALTSAQNYKLSHPDYTHSVYDEIHDDDVYDEIRDSQIRDPEYLELIDDDGPASPKASVMKASITPSESVP